LLVVKEENRTKRQEKRAEEPLLSAVLLFREDNRTDN